MSALNPAGGIFDDQSDFRDAGPSGTSDNIYFTGSGNDDVQVSSLKGIWRLGKGINNNFNGGSNNDIVFGDQGKDYILGGLGDDFLTGGQGADSLTGGADTNTFSYSQK